MIFFEKTVGMNVQMLSARYAHYPGTLIDKFREKGLDQLGLAGE